MVSSSVIEALIEHLPGWAYIPLLIVGLGIGFLVAGSGFKFVGSIFGKSRLRRLA